MLDAIIRNAFKANFAPLYGDGILHGDQTTPVYATDGTITGYSDASDIAIKVQRDAASEAMRRAEGFAEGDVRLIILAGDFEVTTDHSVTAKGVRYRLQTADQDAAGSHWVCRGRP